MNKLLSRINSENLNNTRTITSDCLSRNPVLESVYNTEETLRIVNTIKIQEIKKDQDENIALKELKKKIIDEHGKIYKQHKNKKKIVLSEKLSVELIRNTHINWCHIGTNQLKNRICP